MKRIKEKWQELLERFSWLNREMSLPEILEKLRSVDLMAEVHTYLRTHPALQAVLYWVAATLVGIGSVLYAQIIHATSEMVKITVVQDPYWYLLIAPLGFVMAWWLVFRLAPGATGSGIPQVMAAIETESEYVENRVSTLISMKISVVKVLSSLFCILGGGAIGREGPTIQVAASIFYAIGNRFKKIWPQVSHQALLIAGGAAGLAAAFNTPLGGIVFAIEELSHHHFNRFKTFLISAVIISGMVAQWMLGPYLVFGYPKLEPVSAAFLPWALFTGAFCGIAGATFGKILSRMTERIARLSVPQRIWLAATAGLVMASSGYFLNPHIMGGGVEMVRDLLAGTENKEAPWVLVAGRFFGPLVTFLTGCAGGIFAPSLAAGAAIGSKIAALSHSPHTNLMIILGMAGFLSGVTRAPFTTLVLVLEMTDRHSAIFPLMVTTLVATIGARTVDQHSFYARRRDFYLNLFAAEDAKKAVPEKVPARKS